MRLKVSKSKNAASFYVIKSIYNPDTQKNTSVVVEKLGTETELRKKLDGRDPYEWAKEYIDELNRLEKENKRKVIIERNQSVLINKDEQHSFNGGYLFLQQIYHQLGLHKICNDISSRHKFTYDINSILSRLLYGRILFPSSKLSTFESSKQLLEQPSFELQHVYRSLEVIAEESDFIQSQLYKNSLSLSKRNDRILYYDCTNYFFEIEQEDGLKQYGPSKEHRPNPIVEMGLFMDGDGIPLAFNIHSGNTNEQVTLKPLEKQIIEDFKLSKFVVCTDAGLSSNDNRKFNNINGRSFITTQSIKKLKKFLKEWALEPTGWMHNASNETFDLTQLDDNENLCEQYKNVTFYKERWIKENNLEQKLIVTFSLKYRDYQRQIRTRQVERATKLIDTNPKSIGRKRQNDYKRFIEPTNITSEGEVAEKTLYHLNSDTISEESKYDGFYAVCTNLDEDAAEIARINHQRWEVEECFRIMKSEFKARPVYLQRDDRIKAHFTTCFLALVLYRYLEKDLNSQFTTTEIVGQLKDMNFYLVPGQGFIPTYTRTDFTDALHDSYGFRTDYQIVSDKEMKKIYKKTKK
ncbi:IS1634 family transposase [Petrocella sp. FN5]|uniref:IS1634 family transposase n=1 Tax=Petrocella sp. FN5 TaxID=3032002 RepID=UPI0023D99EE4|nr:IS1634 family transposase [Petrocella sp. FN5]MDF1618792.1 IS1634 family transposase [Petrocella sp. FN5]